MKKKKLYLFFIGLCCSLSLSYSQKKSSELSAIEIKNSIDSICLKLKNIYVFPKTGMKMSSFLSKSYKKGNYDKYYDPKKFANKLTEDLYIISEDKHLKIIYNPQFVSQENIGNSQDSLKFENEKLLKLKNKNFGFKAVKILENNIGYLRLDSFEDIKYAKPTVTSAMNFIRYTKAIVIDLRYNSGGNPNMIQLLSSYFFNEQPVHLNDFYWRPINTYTESWTFKKIDGIRFPNKPIYILISNDTFSAAEEFTYNLKHLKRAVIVGETSKGGAHPGREFKISENFTIWLPFGRAINPITKTNWEGVGVKPEIEVKSKNALLASIELINKN